VSAPHRTSGQAAVELVVLLPVVAVLLAGAWQLALAAQAQWSASAAARAAARAHAVGGPELAAARRALPDSLDHRVTVEDSDDGRVEVHLRIPSIVGGLRLGTLTARASFAPQR
jgi:cytochrome oxidase assembly protein ShyY1